MVTGTTTEDWEDKMFDPQDTTPYSEYFAPSTPTKSGIEKIMELDKGDFPTYIKSFGLGCHYDWDRKYKWYEITKDGKMCLQIESSVTPQRFIELMVEFFTDAWETPPVFIASDKSDKKLFEFCKIFPEFNEKIKDLDIYLKYE